MIYTPMLVQCSARESGGVQCEMMLTSPDEDHAHWISEATIQEHITPVFATFIRAHGVYRYDAEGVLL